MRKLAFSAALIISGFLNVFAQQQSTTKPVSITVSAAAPIPTAFFGLSIFGTPTCQNNVCNPATSYPLKGGIVPGTLGKVGFISGYYLESCDGGTNQASACYHWSNLDLWVNFGVSHGYTLVYDWGPPPGWMCGHAANTSCTTIPSNLTPMSNFATALATRYAGKIKYYETLNEINAPGSWTDTCSNLVLLHNTIYNSIKAVDSNAIVGAPNMEWGAVVGTACQNSPTNANEEWIWMQNFLQTRDPNNNLPRVDTVGEHLYPVVQPILHNVAQRFLNVYNGFRSVMTTAGIPTSRPLLVTEGSFGICTAPLNGTTCLTSQGQIAYIGRWLVLAASTWADGGGLLGNWYAYDINWGTLNGTLGMNSQNSSAYGQMEGWLLGAIFKQKCHTASPSTVFVCDFTDGSRQQAEIIFNDNNGATATYTAPSWATTYKPLLGSISMISGGTVTVGDNPILLK